METIVFEQYPTVPLEDFIQEFSIEFPDLPNHIQTYYVLQAAIQFCERSGVLTREMDICLQSCVPNYSFASPDCTRIYRITGICGGCHTRYATVQDKPCYIDVVGKSVWWDRIQKELWFHPAPSHDTKVKVRACVVPLPDACEVDEILLVEHKQAILAGARYMIYQLPNYPWSSIPLSDRHRAEFDRNIASAGTDRLLGGVTGPIKIRFRNSRGRL